uniref:Uncharacterized protein n=1 Tax=Anguilla anguilla TaxID=7936 RepID=A0A0E9WRC9_ANGAN
MTYSSSQSKACIIYTTTHKLYKEKKHSHTYLRASAGQSSNVASCSLTQNANLSHAALSVFWGTLTTGQ